MQLTTFVLASGYRFLLNVHSQAAILDSKLSRFSDQHNKHKLTDINANILEKLWASMLLQIILSQPLWNRNAMVSRDFFLALLR